MLYIDTSGIVKLYIKEKDSRKTINKIRENDKPIPLTPIHDLEFTNAINLKLFRKELREDEAEMLFDRFSEHEKKGVFHRPQINWPDAMTHAVTLSKRYTPALGSRSLDLMHVALALTIGADRFLTFDRKQSKLASAAGLKT